MRRRSAELISQLMLADRHMKNKGGLITPNNSRHSERSWWAAVTSKYNEETYLAFYSPSNWYIYLMRLQEGLFSNRDRICLIFNWDVVKPSLLKTNRNSDRAENWRGPDLIIKYTSSRLCAFSKHFGGQTSNLKATSELCGYEMVGRAFHKSY